MTTPCKTLSIDDIILIHDKVSRDAIGSGGPIARMSGIGVSHGIKDKGLLESAVARQFMGSHSTLLYPGPIENAATLMYGISKNHAFHDGNKRTAVVALLNHLDRNRLSLLDVRWTEIEDMVLDLVTGKLPLYPKLKHAVAHSKDKSERDVRALTEWVRQNSRPVQRGERIMTFDELEQILKKHGYELADPHGNYIQIYKTQTQKQNKWPGSPQIKKQHIGSMGYPGGKREIGVSEIKKVRRICRLTEEYGVDSAAFYDEALAVDGIINRYRKLLRSLADK